MRDCTVCHTFCTQNGGCGGLVGRYGAAVVVISGIARPCGGCAGGAPVQALLYNCGWPAVGGLLCGGSLLIAPAVVMK